MSGVGQQPWHGTSAARPWRRRIGLCQPQHGPRGRVSAPQCDAGPSVAAGSERALRILSPFSAHICDLPRPFRCCEVTYCVDMRLSTTVMLRLAKGAAGPALVPAAAATRRQATSRLSSSHAPRRPRTGTRSSIASSALRPTTPLRPGRCSTRRPSPGAVRPPQRRIALVRPRPSAASVAAPARVLSTSRTPGGRRPATASAAAATATATAAPGPAPVGVKSSGGGRSRGRSGTPALRRPCSRLTCSRGRSLRCG